MNNFNDLFNAQMDNQEDFLMKGHYDGISKKAEEIRYSKNPFPIDDVDLYRYQMLQLMSELGEILEADKRWKNFRNNKYDKDAKVDEIADCFIVLLNIAMFSEMDADYLFNKIMEKIEVVSDRIHSRKDK